MYLFIISSLPLHTCGVPIDWKPIQKIFGSLNYTLPTSTTKMNKYIAATLACAAAVAAFDPLTLTLGTTSYVLTGAQVGVAIASLGALALAKEGLLLAELSRGKRSTEESRIVKLFRSFNGKVDPLHAQAQYMLAAQTGLYKKPVVCQQQYIKCPYPANNLSDLLKA